MLGVSGDVRGGIDVLQRELERVERADLRLQLEAELVQMAGLDVETRAIARDVIGRLPERLGADRIGCILSANLATEAVSRGESRGARVRGGAGGLPPRFAVVYGVEAPLLRGELAAAGEALADAPAGGQQVHDALLLAARGRLHLAQGRARQALEELREVGRVLERWLGNPTMAPWQAEAVEALVALGVAETSREHLAEALELAQRCSATALEEQARAALVKTGARAAPRAPEPPRSPPPRNESRAWRPPGRPTARSPRRCS